MDAVAPFSYPYHSRKPKICKEKKRLLLIAATWFKRRKSAFVRMAAPFDVG